MKIKDEKLWSEICKINSEGIGLGVVKFARDWANLMEDEIKLGKKVENIAQETSDIIDNSYCVSGWMFKRIIKVLVEVWIYGEELHDWNVKRIV